MYPSLSLLLCVVTYGATTTPPPPLFAVALNDKWGFVDDKGVQQVRPQFDDVGDFSEGMAVVQVDDRYGYIGMDGQFVIKPTFQDAGPFLSGVAWVQIGDKWGPITKSGRFIFDADLESKPRVGPHWAVLGKRGAQWLLIDKTGRPQNDLRFDDVQFSYPFSEDRHGVKLDGKWGYTSSSGEIVIQPRAGLSGRTFYDGRATYSDGTLYGLIDKMGRIVVKAQFESVSPFREGLAWARIPGKKGFVCIDVSGEILFGPDSRWVGVSGFSQGRGEIMIRHSDGKTRSGFVDRTGVTILDPQMDEVRQYSNGLAAVCNNGRWGYVDLAGKIVIPYQFHLAWPFDGKFARVRVGDITTLIDANGKIIWWPH